MPSQVDIASPAESGTPGPPPNGEPPPQDQAAALPPAGPAAVDSPAATVPPATVLAPSLIRSLRMGVIRRMVLGLLFVLPIVLTVVVVYQIYRLLNQWVIEPIAHFVTVPLVADSPYWKSVESYVTPPISLAIVLMFLYLMGYVFQSRLNRWLDWIVDRIPGISILYRAIRDASSAIHGPQGIKTIDKVVLVPFPHPGARATGYLMGESEDEKTGRKLACVYIPIALFPPSGYTLVFWYDDVTITDWDSASPWKMIISGGLTLPGKVPFRQ
jgi:uncharacterized membrane protein